MKRKPAVVATMGKTCEIMYHCLKEGEVYTTRQRTFEPEGRQASHKYSHQVEMLPLIVAAPLASDPREECDVDVASYPARGCSPP